jgi:copper(I)-binding protein
MFHKQIIAIAGGLVGLAATAAAQPAPAVHVEHPWARATPPHAATGAVYLSLTASAADRFTGASTPAAAQAELHESSMTAAGVMQMRPVDGLDLPAGKTVTLAPEHYHLMLTGLKAPLVAGKTISVHLTFAHAAPVDVSVPVLRAGAAGPGGTKPIGDMPGMKM